QDGAVFLSFQLRPQAQGLAVVLAKRLPGLPPVDACKVVIRSLAHHEVLGKVRLAFAFASHQAASMAFQFGWSRARSGRSRCRRTVDRSTNGRPAKFWRKEMPIFASRAHCVLRRLDSVNSAT